MITQWAAQEMQVLEMRQLRLARLLQQQSSSSSGTRWHFSGTRNGPWR
jgi:hypothetical protein